MRGSVNKKYADTPTTTAERRETATVWLILIKKSTKPAKKRKADTRRRAGGPRQQLEDRIARHLLRRRLASEHACRERTNAERFGDIGAPTVA